MKFHRQVLIFFFSIYSKIFISVCNFTPVFFKTLSDTNLINDEIRLLKEKKEQAQPTKIKTSGSTFKNPIDQSDKKVWQLIKESVPLEKSFGDATISEKHCNFFVNKGNARFKDMKKLIEFVSKTVFEKTGIKLETEIKILE